MCAGVLALGEALLVLLTPHLDTTAQPHLALAWAIRFAAIAALNYSLLVRAFFTTMPPMSWLCSMAR